MKRGGDPERISFWSLQPESEKECPLSGQKVKMNPCLVQTETLLEVFSGKKGRMHRKQYMKSMGGKRASQPTWNILSRWPDQRDSFKYENLGDTTDWEGHLFFFAESGIIGYFLTQSESPISGGGGSGVVQLLSWIQSNRDGSFTANKILLAVSWANPTVKHSPSEIPVLLRDME